MMSMNCWRVPLQDPERFGSFQNPQARMDVL
jgi:hypothetical protein